MSSGTFVGNKKYFIFSKIPHEVCILAPSVSPYTKKYIFSDPVKLLSVYHNNIIVLLSTGHIFSLDKGGASILLKLPSDINVDEIIKMANSFEFISLATKKILYIFNISNQKTQLVQFKETEIIDVQSIANSFIVLLSNGYVVTNKNVIEGATLVEIYNHLFIYSFGQRVYAMAVFHKNAVLFLENTTILFLKLLKARVFTTKYNKKLLYGTNPVSYLSTRCYLILFYDFGKKKTKSRMFLFAYNQFIENKMEIPYNLEQEATPIVSSFNPLQPFLLSDQIRILDEKTVEVITLFKSDASLPPGMQLSRNGHSYTYLSDYNGHIVLWREGRARKMHPSQLTKFHFDCAPGHIINNITFKNVKIQTVTPICSSHHVGDYVEVPCGKKGKFLGEFRNLYYVELEENKELAIYKKDDLLKTILRNGK